MKKTLVLFILMFLVASCNKKFETAMKSADKELILNTANDYFAQKKWSQAISLYERLPNLVAGTDDARTVVFNTASAHYYDKQYRIAGHHFKNFSVTFPDDPKAEEAAYMSALCYYEGSLDYNLDQANTELAINELQNFLNNYPNSERSKNINTLIEELTYKLEFKAYEHARQYYKMAEYKAADVAFENVLEDYPGTKLRPTIYDFIMKSKYELATNSLFDKKAERIDNALAYSKFIEKELPESSQAKTAIKLREKLEAEKIKFAELKKQVDAERAKYAEKQKKAIAEMEERENKRKASKTKTEEISDSEKTKIDSATTTTTPTSTFKIRRN